MPRSELPPVDHAVSLVALSAAAMSEVSRGAPAPEAQQEFDDLDRRLGSGVLPDPMSNAYKAAHMYLMCAGDFLAGMQYVVDPQPNLWFSSASLARSTCEYANRASWLAEPEITDDLRIRRGIAVIEDSLQNERALQESAVLASLDGLSSGLNKWKLEHGFLKRLRVPGPTELFELLDPEGGREIYRRLSNAAHGSFLTMMWSHGAATREHQHGPAELWWRVLMASQYGLTACKRILTLQRNSPPAAFEYAWMMCATLVVQCQAADAGDL